MIVFYVNGHGFGHATRSGAIMEALRRLSPETAIAVRTSAPKHLFPADVHYTNIDVQGGIVESPDALTVDLNASARNLQQHLDGARCWVQRESNFLRETGAAAIAADIPFLPGELARATGLPAIALGNFLWDWILEPAGDAVLLQRVREAYAGFTGALRMPFFHRDGWDVFPYVEDVPLVAPRPRQRRDVIRRRLGVRTTAVLVAGRGRLSEESLGRIRAECPDFDFLFPGDLPWFSDLVSAADVAVTKLGYSMVAECVAANVRIVYPPRTGFREESEILAVEAPEFVPALPIPNEDWQAGRWKSYLEAVRRLPAARKSLAANGSEVCTRHLLRVAFPSLRL